MSPVGFWALGQPTPHLLSSLHPWFLGCRAAMTGMDGYGMALKENFVVLPDTFWAGSLSKGMFARWHLSTLLLPASQHPCSRSSSRLLQRVMVKKKKRERETLDNPSLMSPVLRDKGNPGCCFSGSGEQDLR